MLSFDVRFTVYSIVFWPHENLCFLFYSEAVHTEYIKI